MDPLHPESPADRLALSRERLRRALQGDQESPDKKANKSREALDRPWLNRLKAIPGFSVVSESISNWWAQHPLRLVYKVTTDVANVALQPVAQRHPAGLILASIVFGGVFAWSRPWRWIIKPALFAGLVPQLFSKVLSHAPVQKWTTVLSAMEKKKSMPSAGFRKTTASEFHERTNRPQK